MINEKNINKDGEDINGRDANGRDANGLGFSLNFIFNQYRIDLKNYIKDKFRVISTYLYY